MAEAESNHSLEFKSCQHTHFDHLLRSATLLHFMTMEYITSNKGGRKLAFENNISIKQKVLSNGTVWGDFVQGDFVLEPDGDAVLQHVLNDDNAFQDVQVLDPAPAEQPAGKSSSYRCGRFLFPRSHLFLVFCRRGKFVSLVFLIFSSALRILFMW